VGERLRRVVHDTVVHDGEQEVRVTISVGATAYPELDVADEIALVGLADRALYRAKDAGRNQVVVG
jgi:two-component system, cell cycle response regulator